MSVLTSLPRKRRHILGVALTQADVARLKFKDSQLFRSARVIRKVGMEVQE